MQKLNFSLCLLILSLVSNYNYSQELPWENIGPYFGSVEVYDFVVFPEDPDKILVAFTDSLAKTNDGGNSWVTSSSSISRLAVNKQDTSIMFAGEKSKRYRGIIDFFKCSKSLNGGSNFFYKNMFLAQGLYNYYYTMMIGDILIFPDNPQNILIGVDGSGFAGAGLYKSTDGGGWWDQEFSIGVSTIAMDPTNNNIVYLGTTNLGYVSRSDNGGNTWTRISPEGDNAFATNVWDLEVDKNGQVLAATSSGLFKWEGNEDWTLIQEFPTINTSTIVIDNFSANLVYYVGTSDEGVFASYDNGATWESFNGELGNLNITRLRINDSYPKYLYAGTEAGVWRTLLKESGIKTEEYISICNDEEYNGWTESGIYQRTLISSSGIDSVVTTYLTVNYGYTRIDFTYTYICEGENYFGITEEGEHQLVFERVVNGCDSTLFIRLKFRPVFNIVEDVSICEGDNYLGINEAGEHRREFKTVNGCDSVVVTNLTFYQSFKPTFTNNADTLNSDLEYANYRWYNSEGVIEGATNQEYVIEKSSEYYLEATNENGCTYSSDVKTVNLTSIDNFKTGGFTYSVMPNPNNGVFRFTIDSNPPEKLIVKLFNGLGQVMETRNVENPAINQIEHFNVSHLSKGIYHFEITTNKFRESHKIIIQ
jgi:hypothetical protein